MNPEVRGKWRLPEKLLAIGVLVGCVSLQAVAAVGPDGSVLDTKNAKESTCDQLLANLARGESAACIVRTLEPGDLHRLVRADAEVGIAVIHGQIIVFTSGDPHQLRVPIAAQGALREASLLAHTHPDGTRSGPSPWDLEQAGSAVEYVATPSGAFAYQRNQTVRSVSEEELIALIHASRLGSGCSTEAREVLKSLVADTTDRDGHAEAYATFRAAQPITILPGEPRLVAWGEKAPQPAPTLTSSNVFAFDYDVRNVDSSVGVCAEFPNAQDLSGLQYFSLDVSGTAVSFGNCMKVEFKDATDRKGAYYISMITTTNRNWAVALAQIRAHAPQLDMTKIKRISFIIESSEALARMDTLSITLGGLRAVAADGQQGSGDATAGKAEDRAKAVDAEGGGAEMRGGVGASIARDMAAHDATRRGDYATAQRLYKTALEASGEGKSTYSLHELCRQLGDGFRRKGDSEEAEAWFKRSLELSWGASRLDRSAFTLECLGRLYDEQSRWQEARIAYEESLAQRVQVSGRDIVGSMYLKIGDFWARRGDTNRAVAVFLEGLSAVKDHDDIPAHSIIIQELKRLGVKVDVASLPPYQNTTVKPTVALEPGASPMRLRFSVENTGLKPVAVSPPFINQTQLLLVKPNGVASIIREEMEMRGKADLLAAGKSRSWTVDISKHFEDEPPGTYKVILQVNWQQSDPVVVVYAP